MSINWWSDLWIKEGLAELLPYLILEELRTSLENDFIDKELLSYNWCLFNLKQLEAFEHELDLMQPMNPIILNTHDLIKYYNPIAYQRGATFFRNLSLLVGSKLFYSILKKISHFYSHHNISTSILYNLIKVMIRNMGMDDDEVCMLEEEFFESYWFDNVILPFYSCIQVIGFSFNDSIKTLEISFEDCSLKLPFEEKLKQEYLNPNIEDMEAIHSKGSIAKAMACHSAEELVSHQIPIIHAVNRVTVASRSNYFMVTVFDENCQVIFENWCKICLSTSKKLVIPGIQAVPRAVLLNSRCESYCRVFPDDETLTFFLGNCRILEVSNTQIRSSLYLAVATSPSVSAWEKPLALCLQKESRFLQRLVSSKFFFQYKN